MIFLGLAAVVILGATVVTAITSLSMSAISTNGVIKGGRVLFDFFLYLISFLVSDYFNV